jgi:Family of unknown function (DUF5701)
MQKSESTTVSATSLGVEFDRQVSNLLQKGYPGVAGVTAEEFMQHIEPLRASLREFAPLQKEANEGSVPFVIIVKSELVPAETAVQLVERKGKKGFTILDADDLKAFKSVEIVKIPAGMAYLVMDIDTGAKTLNVTPDEAMKLLRSENRSPLTIDEGIALVTHYPEIVRKNNGLSLPGSRCGDRRVTALWISEGRPKLGWCWAGNPHTWLGSASCGSRVGA